MEIRDGFGGREATHLHRLARRPTTARPRLGRAQVGCFAAIENQRCLNRLRKNLGGMNQRKPSDYATHLVRAPSF
jgi:hypothetical protein